MEPHDPTNGATEDTPPGVRPVRVDEQGLLFYEDTGEQLIMPGLEPEAVLESLAQAEAGGGRSLREIMAQRRHADGL